MTKIVFISYSWGIEATKKYVLELAKELSKYKEVEIILDKINLKPGHDMNSFMERSVIESDKVLIVCDEDYKRKADSRSSGAGTETQIISPQVYGAINQTKFIPLIINSQTNLPIYLSSRLGIIIKNYDLSDEKIYEIMKNILEYKDIKMPEEKISFFQKNKIEKEIAKLITLGDSVKLSEFSLNSLLGYITGDSDKTIYRKGTELVDFFNSFGKRDVYSWGNGGLPGKVSRKDYVKNCLNEFNGTDQMKKIIESIVDRRFYIGTEYDVGGVVTEINDIITYDGYILLEESDIYVLCNKS